MSTLTGSTAPGSAELLVLDTVEVLEAIADDGHEGIPAFATSRVEGDYPFSWVGVDIGIADGASTAAGIDRVRVYVEDLDSADVTVVAFTRTGVEVTRARFTAVHPAFTASIASFIGNLLAVGVDL